MLGTIKKKQKKQGGRNHWQAGRQGASSRKYLPQQLTLEGCTLQQQ